NFEALHLFKDVDIYKETDQSFNLFNALATKQLAQFGVKGGVISPELTSREVEALSKGAFIDCVLPVYGRQEVMVSANCVLNCEKKQCRRCKNQGSYTLTDERGAGFPMRLDERGITHIYNGDKLVLKNEILHQHFIAKWRLYTLYENKDTLMDAAEYYKKGIFTGALELAGGEGIRYTKGNYKRGVE
ncbi:MAG: hypothetical protein RR614_08450, partial [Eubacterium sp.]